MSRVVLREQVKEVILQRIMTREYAPGDRLVETRIAQELGTSQAPVREALRELELMRFVESAPFKGCRVREVTEEELLEIYPVRAALEELAAREAATKLDGDVEALERELDAMHAAADAYDLHDQVAHDVAFHQLIVEAAGNTILADAWGFLHIESRTIVTVIRTQLDGHEIAERHRPILDALRNRDGDAAAEALRRHLQELAQQLKAGS